MWRWIGWIILVLATVNPAFAQPPDPAEQEWRKQISTRLASSKRFPPQARGQQGTVKVGFVVDRAGRLVSSWLVENSGVTALDEAALAIVERAQPFPPPPDGLSDWRTRR